MTTQRWTKGDWLSFRRTFVCCSALHHCQLRWCKPSPGSFLGHYNLATTKIYLLSRLQLLMSLKRVPVMRESNMRKIPRLSWLSARPQPDAKVRPSWFYFLPHESLVADTGFRWYSHNLLHCSGDHDCSPYNPCSVLWCLRRGKGYGWRSRYWYCYPKSHCGANIRVYVLSSICTSTAHSISMQDLFLSASLLIGSCVFSIAHHITSSHYNKLHARIIAIRLFLT